MRPAPDHQHRGPAPRRAPPRPARRLRLHRRRRRRRNHACARTARPSKRSRSVRATRSGRPSAICATTVAGIPLSMPFMLAPVGSSRMFYPRGEEVAAAAAGAAGTPYILSTFSGCRLEDVKAATTGPACCSCISSATATVSTSMMQRARAAGYSALVVTIDTAVAGMRERDFRNGSRGARRPAGSARCCRSSPQFLARPRWLLRFLRDGGMMKFPNVVLPDSGPMAYADVGGSLAKSVVTWADFALDPRRLERARCSSRACTPADDARQALDVGADGVVVSNHGGRQLDGVAATLRVLPEVLDAVGTPHRSPRRRRHPPRQRHRQGALPGRPRRPHRPRLRLRPRRRRPGRRRPRDRHPPDRHDPDDEAARMSEGVGQLGRQFIE